MSIRVVRVADSRTGLPLLAKVSDARYLDIERNVKPIADRLFTADSYKAMMGRPMTAQDAQEALVFFVSQLTYEETEMQARYYVPMQYKDFVPISTAAGPWADSITYYVYDKVGNAQFASTAANDIPYVDVAFAQKTFGIHSATVGYKYTQDELRKSAYLKRPLPELRQQVAIEASERLINTTMLLGNTNKNLTGLYNNATVTHAATPSTKKWDGTDGTPATVAQILSDFAFGLYSTWLASGFNVVANAVLIPPGAYQYLSVTPASPTIPTVTILQYLAMNNLYTQKTKQPLMIDAGFDLATAGASGVGRAVFYDKNPTTLIGHIPMPLQFLAPQYDGIDVKIPGEFKLSGVEVRRVTNMYYMDGVQ
jgi:hypothetical protein